VDGANTQRIIPKLLAVRQQVVLFFQMTTCMDYVAQYFDARGYRYLRLDGHASGEERTTAMHLFSAPNPDYYLFIATTRAGGQGINLQTAATVIHFESDWNPHADQQAQARYVAGAARDRRGRD
jgi:SNF2 family DNA or RNA helicase